LLLPAGLFCLSGCDGPQSTLQPAGDAARVTAALWWGMFGVSVLVTAAFTALWLYALRTRRETPDMAQQRRTQRRLMIGGGVLLPVTAIVVLLGFGIPAGHGMLPWPDDGTTPLRIEITGHQWWWQVHYPDAGVTTANRLHLPVARPVDLHVRSADVIHAFWVPRLGGKIDAIPGRSNVLRLRATETGVMRAQCAEFCGLGHAHMAMDVEVMAAPAFEQWLSQQQQPVARDSAHTEGRAAFREHCAACHGVRGVAPQGSGPDLTTVALRKEGLLGWLQGHDAGFSAPGVPAHRALVPTRQPAIVAWLESLP